MPLGLPDIGLGQIEAERGQPGPALFDEIEKAARPAANVEKTQPALVAPGEDLVERRPRLTPRGVRGAVEEHFDLRLVSPGSLVRHPAARLEMEILERVAGPLPARLLGQYFAVVAALPAAVDGGKILEEEPRALEKHFQ